MDDQAKSNNQVAPPHAVFVCLACGKRSKDLYGYQRIDKEWDESCIMNSILCDERTLVMKGELVTSACPWEDETQSPPGDDVTQPPPPQG